jgi:hypothetical protein
MGMKIKLLLGLCMIVLVGCGGQSPTGVDDSVQPNALLANSPVVLHAMLVVDTNATDIASALQNDLQAMTTLLDDIADSTGVTVDRLIYSGNNVTVENIRHGLVTLSSGANDAILFYYSGHGGRLSDTPSQWPNMYFHKTTQGNGMNLSEVFALLTGKGSRLVVVLGDTCNSVLHTPQQVQARQKTSAAKQVAEYRKLFVESRAAILCSSSRPGERSYAAPDGSLFTQQFVWAVNREIARGGTNWSYVMKLAAYPQLTGDLQHPQFIIQ